MGGGEGGEVPPGLLEDPERGRTRAKGDKPLSVSFDGKDDHGFDDDNHDAGPRSTHQNQLSQWNAFQNVDAELIIFLIRDDG